MAIIVAVIAVIGVLASAAVQWKIGTRSSAALAKSAEAAKQSAGAAVVSAQAASKSAQAAQDAVGVDANSAAGLAQRAEADALAKRYAEAAEHLGHAKAPVRLAGVYAMARLADDWVGQRQTCIDVLCSYLRMPPTQEPGDAGAPSEIEVRKSIVAMLEAHLRPHRLRAVPSWSSNTFDLRGATLVDVQMDSIELQQPLHLYKAKFSGSCALSLSRGPSLDLHHNTVVGTLVVCQSKKIQVGDATVEAGGSLQLLLGSAAAASVIRDAQVAGLIAVHIGFGREPRPVVIRSCNFSEEGHLRLTLIDFAGIDVAPSNGGKLPPVIVSQCTFAAGARITTPSDVSVKYVDCTGHEAASKRA